MKKDGECCVLWWNKERWNARNARIVGPRAPERFPEGYGIDFLGDFPRFPSGIKFVSFSRFIDLNTNLASMAMFSPSCCCRFWVSSPILLSFCFNAMLSDWLVSSRVTSISATLGKENQLLKKMPMFENLRCATAMIGDEKRVWVTSNRRNSELVLCSALVSYGGPQLPCLYCHDGIRFTYIHEPNRDFTSVVEI